MARLAVACLASYTADLVADMPRTNVAKPQRTTDATVFVRCSAAEKRALLEACQREVAGVEGAKLPLGAFLLREGLRRAEALGIAVPKRRDG